MPRILTVEKSPPSEAMIRQLARSKFGAGEFRMFPNPQVRGLYVKLDPRTHEFIGKPFMAAAGLMVGAGDWIGWQTLGPNVLRALADAGRSVARFDSVEWKKPGGVTSAEQVAWAEAVRSAGGFATVVDSVDGYGAALERARRGEDR